MNNISVKIDKNLQNKLTRTASKSRISQSELIRRALHQYLDEEDSNQEFKSAAAMAGELAGCIHGEPGDLADNPAYLDDFGH